MNARWLSLPLSARGLLRELADNVDDDGAFVTTLHEDADVAAVGDEVARLLCAFRAEYTRVRRDAAMLVERGFLVVEDSRLRLVDHDVEHAPISGVTLTSKPSDRGSAKRMRDLRARRRAAATPSPSHVTPSDAGDASLPLSFKNNKIDLAEERARERHRDVTRDGPGLRRCITRDTPFDERARAIAEKVGLRDGETAWFGFAAHCGGRESEQAWEDRWQKWAARQVTWDRAKPTSAKQDVDLDAPWMRAAMGASS